MVLSGVSNREVLVALVLFESAWWGTVCLGRTLPSFFIHNFELPSGIQALGFFSLIGVLALKLLSVGFFCVAALQKKRQTSKSCLKIWYSGNLVLDITFLSFLCGYGIYYHVIIGMPFPASFFTFLILRILFWIIATLVVRSVNSDDGGKPESELAGWAWEKAFLLWEIFWYITVILVFMEKGLLGPSWDIMLPDYHVTDWTTTATYGTMLLSALITLLSILRNWKAFLKFWLAFYTFAGFGLYIFSNFGEFVYHWAAAGKQERLAALIDSGTAIFFAGTVLVLRTVALIHCIGIAYSQPVSSEATGKESADTSGLQGTTSEKQPLISLPQKSNESKK